MTLLTDRPEGAEGPDSPSADHAKPRPLSSKVFPKLPEGGAGRLPNMRLWKILATCVSLGILGLSLIVLARALTSANYYAVRQAIQATSATQIAVALGFAACSYLALTGYDFVALRQLRLKVPYRTAALASFTSYAISFTMGFPLITAGAVRYWIYSQAGVRASKVASLTVIAGVTFWLGMALVLGVALTLQSSGLAALDHLSRLVNLSVGLATLAALAGYVVWVAQGPRRTRIQGLRLELPGLGLSIGQIMLGVADLCAASAVLYVLLPAGHGLSFPSFAAVYVFACLLGIASNVPGGVGAFEAAILKIVPSPTPEALLASLLVFRVLYYIVPFVLALALLGAHEARRRWKSLREAMSGDAEDEDSG
ncbi:MAG TPA: YbhN family protein [Beijerinckiaceae bacterium]|nr:YbhN family protein [Beijerinckiaceae bacterium]